MNTRERLINIARAYFMEARGSHRWDHTQRVLNLSLHIGEKEEADLEILRPASILHDIGRADEDNREGQICHATRGAELAESILQREGYHSKQIKRIVHCIATHRFRDDKTPQSLEARVLFDADKLDSIGAVGIGRAFLFAGEIGAQLHDKNVDPVKTQSYSREDTAYREYLVKLRYVKDRMLTSEGRRMAQVRHHFIVDFFNRLNQEIDGVM